jgi:zinc transporter ZupT
VTTQIVLVLTFAWITALATGLGALPFAFLKEVSPRAKSRANAIASGLMLGASFGLIIEGSTYGAWQTLAGAGLGIIFILLGERLISQNPEIKLAGVKSGGAKQVLLVLATMTVHSFAEGVAVGVAFGGGEKLAALITIAIAVHNIPEGLAISAVMRSRGSSVLSCAGWSIFSSLPQPAMAVPAFVFVEAFKPFLPYGLGFAAGAMVFMVFLELLPEAYQGASKSSIGLWVSTTLGLMILFQIYL